MFFIKRVLLLSSLIIFIIFINKYKQDEIIIPNNAIRFRVIANSNNKVDQELKKQIIKNLKSYFALNSTNITDARKEILNNKDNIQQNINKTIKENNLNTSVSLKYGMNYFPEKTYYGKKYSKGYYESLVIKIGRSKGRNYWCVLYPPLCLIDNSVEKKGYKSLIKEILLKYKQ